MEKIRQIKSLWIAIMLALGMAAFLLDINKVASMTAVRFSPKNMPPKYTIRDISFPSTSQFEYASVTAINDRGQVIGHLSFVSDTSMPGRSFLWQDGKSLALPDLGEGSTVHAINNAGDIVGSVDNHEIGYQPVMWPGDQPDKLVRLSSKCESASAINNVGHILISGPHGTILWRPDEPPMPIMSKESHATGINDYNEIAVYTCGGHDMGGNPIDEHAFLFRDGKLEALKTLVGKRNACTAINEHGLMVGWERVGLFEERACLWKDGKPQLLDAADGSFNQARAVNNQGDIVGTATGSKGHEYACLWKGGKAIDLNTLLPPNSGWKLFNAVGINNHGQIIGSGTFKGESLAYLLSPKEQTSTL